MTSDPTGSASDPSYDLTRWPHVTVATTLPCPPWCELPAGHPLDVDAQTSAIPGHPVPIEHRHEVSAAYWRPASYQRAHVHSTPVTPDCVVSVEAWETALTPHGPSSTSTASITITGATELTSEAAAALTTALIEVVPLADSM